MITSEWLSDLISWIVENIEWLFSGIGAAILIWFMQRFFRIKSKKESNVTQLSGESSINITASGNVNYGMQPADVRTMIKEIMTPPNVLELSAQANQTFNSRYKDQSDKITDALFREIPEKVYKLNQPSVQYSLFHSIMGYAKTGDEGLSEYLLALLIARIESEERSLEQIVLDESIQVIPKLTKQHVDTLSLILLITKWNHSTLTTEQELLDFINKFYGPFLSSITESSALYEHLEYCGCIGMLSIAYDPIPSQYQTQFVNLFNDGFTEAELQQWIPTLKDDPHLVYKPENSDKYRFTYFNLDLVNNHLIAKGLGKNELAAIRNLLSNCSWKPDKIRQFLNDNLPMLEQLIRVYSSSDMCACNLTTVGKAIALTNIDVTLKTKHYLNSFLE